MVSIEAVLKAATILQYQHFNSKIKQPNYRLITSENNT